MMYESYLVTFFLLTNNKFLVSFDIVFKIYHFDVYKVKGAYNIHL